MTEFCEVLQQVGRHAVGTGTYHEAYHTIDAECFFISLSQEVERCIGVGICLEVCQVLHRGVFAGEELLTLFELLGYAFGGDAVVGIECLVVAICASARADGAVAVGTCESCVD